MIAVKVRTARAAAAQWVRRLDGGTSALCETGAGDTVLAQAAAPDVDYGLSHKSQPQLRQYRTSQYGIPPSQIQRKIEVITCGHHEIDDGVTVLP